MNKAELRRSLQRWRQSLPVWEWQQKSQQICEHLQATTLFQTAQTILAYFSIRQEPDLSPLFQSDKTWGFPRCVDQSLVWHRWSASEPLNQGAYDIPEPYPEAPLLTPETVDLMLVPAIACDQQGFRLGYGGGFYDRLLSSPAWAAKLKIGIVFEFARIAKLPVDPWDQPLQGVCTETGLTFTSEQDAGVGKRIVPTHRHSRSG